MTVLFIGFGSIAKKHLKALLLVHPDSIVYALRSNANAEQIPNVINLYNWPDVPGQIDFAIIATPTYLHMASLEILIEKQIPVMLEKPISGSLNQLDLLSEKILHQNLFTYIACNLRFLPVLQFLKKYLEEHQPVINEVNVYAGSFLPEWRPGTDFRMSYSANANMGGGVHLDLFHELDYMCWIFGFPQSTYSVKRSVSSLQINSIDYALYVWEYEKFTSSIILNYYRKTPKRNIEIVFDDDVWNVDLLKNEITNKDSGFVFKDSQTTIAHTYLNQMKYFTSSFADKGAVNVNSFQSSLEVLKLCLS